MAVSVAEQTGLIITWSETPRTGLEVIKLEYSLTLKIKRNDWLLRVRKQPIIALYFESENELKFYNLEAGFAASRPILPVYHKTGG